MASVAVAAGIGLGGARGADAHMAGIWDCARDDVPCWQGGRTLPGCGSTTCHGSVAQGVATQVMITGLPDQGYEAGQSYDITVWVVGAPIYTPVDNGCRFPLLPVFAGGNALAGFDLEPTLGRLLKREPDLETVQIEDMTDCDLVARVTGCGPDLGGPPCPPCSPSGVVTSQATHSLTGNDQISWNLTWIAPAAGAGDVTFHLGGNAVNGNCRADLGDRWSLGRMVVHPAAGY